MAKKNARLTKSLAGTEMKLEQLHACVNQIPAEESGLHLLKGMKREMVICANGGLSSAHRVSGHAAVVNVPPINSMTSFHEWPGRSHRQSTSLTSTAPR
ncbi:MAG TPA: hypothetical protein VN650_00955 [Gemmatimonadaceae bacterium]|nr:hypothetical protein [Gemmatimonadaceae bacterium]